MASYRLLSFEKDSITVPGILVDGNVFDLRSEMACMRRLMTPIVDRRSVGRLGHGPTPVEQISNSPGSRATPLEQIVLANQSRIRGPFTVPRRTILTMRLKWAIR